MKSLKYLLTAAILSSASVGIASEVSMKGTVTGFDEYKNYTLESNGKLVNLYFPTPTNIEPNQELVVTGLMKPESNTFKVKEAKVILY